MIIPFRVATEGRLSCAMVAMKISKKIIILWLKASLSEGMIIVWI